MSMARFTATDLLGEIRITTDGVSLWVESDNGEPEQLL